MDPFASFTEASSAPPVQQATPTQSGAQAQVKEEDNLFANFDDQPNKSSGVSSRREPWATYSLKALSSP